MKTKLHPAIEAKTWKFIKNFNLAHERDSEKITEDTQVSRLYIYFDSYNGLDVTYHGSKRITLVIHLNQEYYEYLG